MRIRELRAKAREDSEGNKMTLAMPMFITTVVIYLLGLLPNLLSIGVGKAIVSILSGIAVMLISVSASYALVIRTLQVARKEEKSNFFADVFGEGMRNGWSCAWGVFKKIWYWIVLIVVGYVLIIGGVVFGIGTGISILANGTSDLSTIQHPGTFWALALIGIVLVIFAAIKITIATYKYFLVTYLKHDYPDKSTQELLEKSKEMMEGNKAKAFVIPLTFIGWLLLSSVCGAIVSVVFNLIWPPVSYFGTTVSTIPVWGQILMNVLIYFIASFVTVYLQMTYCEFYLERNPLEIYNEDYVKPETNEKKYKSIIGWTVGAIVIVYVAIIAIGGALFNMASNTLYNNYNSSLSGYSLNQ